MVRDRVVVHRAWGVRAKIACQSADDAVGVRGRRDDSGCAVYDSGFMPLTSSALIVVLPTAITELFREPFYRADRRYPIM